MTDVVYGGWARGMLALMDATRWGVHIGCFGAKKIVLSK